MRRIAVVLVLLAALYCGYWLLLARGVEAAARAGLGDPAVAARVSHDALEVGGFPLRLTLDLGHVAVREGDARFAADSLRIEAPALAPLRLTAVLPPEVRLGLGAQSFRIANAGEIRPRLSLAPHPDLPFRSAAVELAAPRLLFEPPETLAAASVDVPDEVEMLAARVARLAAEAAAPAADGKGAVRIEGSVEALDLRSEVIAGLLPGLGLPPRIAQIGADLTLGLDAPLDRHGRAGTVERAEIARFTLDWGPVGLDAAGAVEIRPDGRPEGEIVLGMTGWRTLLDMAAASGALERRLILPLSLVLTSISDDAGRAALPLVFRDGNMNFGPLPLGPAPVLR